MLRAAQVKLAQLIRSRRVASLATLRKGHPMVTMVMYAQTVDFSEFYIHTSRLAMHTQNLLKHDDVSLLICESDDNLTDPQTLARISISGLAKPLEAPERAFATAKAAYLDKYPSALINFQLGDFAIYKITAKKARYVAGFGEIYNLTPTDLLEIAQCE